MIKIGKYLAMAACLLMAYSCSEHEKVEWVATTVDLPWDSRGSAYVGSVEENEPAIVIYPDSGRQVINGFGGCFNELGWESLQSLPEAKRKEVAKDLFDTIAGMRFTIYRMPIGANDYAVNWYSHNETAEDYEMKIFSLERDRQRLIPYIKMAQSFNPSLQVWASPWCPPAWMKTNNHYACRSNAEFNDLPLDRQGEEMVTQFRMEPKVLSAYALYFEKFIQGYEAEGIEISAVHPQNELNSCQNFPSCI